MGAIVEAARRDDQASAEHGSPAFAAAHDEPRPVWVDEFGEQLASGSAEPRVRRLCPEHQDHLVLESLELVSRMIGVIADLSAQTGEQHMLIRFERRRPVNAVISG